MKIILISFFMIMLVPVRIFATEEADPLSVYDFSDINSVLKDDNAFNFEDCVREIIKGDFDTGFSGLFDMFSSAIFSELANEKAIIIKLIVVGLTAALFSNIAFTVLSGKISETGFYITYLALIVCMLSGYTIVAEIVKNTMDRLSSFMEAVTPVYILSIGFSTGESTATAFYQVVIMVITLIEKVLINFIIPMIYTYMIIGLINNMANGTLFTKAGELIKTIIEWTLKTLMTFVIGINVIRSLINPIVDSMKVGTMWKVMQSIPGIGNTLNSVSSVVFASGTLIKNGIGISAMIAILVICFIPVVKTSVIAISYKGVSAILEPVSDKRIVNSINTIHISFCLMLKTLLYATVFFILTIAIICASTNLNVG